ncbi:SCY1-like protein 2 [Condylostylus longicornis]|uniref:SCY1-like protein 2 n=1 Tax=Condylostylus longicornis TaxID=2530218 RepID=UPI00244DBEF5|nr:SCY1-like protein 2 [Condylostylus longicornis]
MDVFNKFYSSVSTTVSQLSSVLPGIHLSGHEIQEQVGTAGIGSFWKIHNGIKKTTKENVSIFVFEKKTLERFNKEEREHLLGILRKSIQQLTKIRHPQILEVRHPLEENRDCLAFATEPIFKCLSDSISSTNVEDKLSDLEIKYGLLQLIEGLNFLHSEMKIVHCNLTPNNVIINQNGKWKLFGFDFFITGQMKDGSYEWIYEGFNANLNIVLQPPLEHLAPETGLNYSITTDSDLYSFGVLIYCIYNKGKPMKNFFGKYDSFKNFCKEINLGRFPSFDCIPLELRDSLKSLMHSSPLHRTKLHEFRNVSFFNDMEVKSLTHLDSLYRLDNLEKSKFLKGVGDVIRAFPLRVNLQIILPNLVKEYINPQMIPFVLQNVFIIAKQCESEQYRKHIFPHLIPVMKIHEPIQIFYVILQNMDLILSASSKENIKYHVLPMLYKALDSNNSNLQEMCMKVLPEISSLIDSSAMKNILLPKIQSLCLNSGSLSVKVNGLICIGHLLDNLDKWLVSDIILPFLVKIPNREPAIIMAVIGIFKLIMANKKLGLSKSEIATKVIPYLMPLSIENSLTMNEFNSIINLVKDLVNRVETEHRSKIEQSVNNSTLPTTIPDPVHELDLSNSSNNFSIDKVPERQEIKIQNIESNLNSEIEKHFQISSKLAINNVNPTIQPSPNYSTISKESFSNSQIIHNPFNQTSSHGNNNKPLTIESNMNNVKIAPTNNSKGSCFQDLDPFASTTHKVPMNQIPISNSSFNNFEILRPNSNNLNFQNNNSSSNINQLSQQDILDFLK